MRAGPSACGVLFCCAERNLQHSSRTLLHHCLVMWTWVVKWALPAS